MIFLIMVVLCFMFYAAFFMGLYQQKQEKKEKEAEKRYREEVLRALKERQREGEDKRA